MELLNHFYTSVEKSLTEIDPNWRDYKGLIVCGTHSPNDVEKTLTRIKEARESNTPFLGICMGMQLMAIEYARNVLKIGNATSEEIGRGSYIISKMRELRVGMKEAAWGGKLVKESFWHNYEFNTHYLQFFKDWKIEQAEDIVTFMKLRDNYFGCQFHPEYQSSKDKPHLLLKQFLDVCKM